MARQIGDRTGIYNALYNLALVALVQGQYELASSRFGEGMTLSEEMGDHANIAYCLEGLATIAGAQGQVKRSVHLFGAAEGLYEIIGVLVWTFYKPDRSLYERTIADLRALLGEEAFETAWVEGKAIAPKQAIEYATSEEEPLRPTASTPQTDSEILTPREAEVLRQISSGASNQQGDYTLTARKRW